MANSLAFDFQLDLFLYFNHPKNLFVLQNLSYFLINFHFILIIYLLRF